MTPSTPCPDNDQLAALLRDQLPADQTESLTDHIDQCPACQQRLNEWAFNTDSWKDVAAALQAGSADDDPVLDRVVEEFHVIPNRTIDYETPNDAAPDDIPSALGLPSRYRMADEIARGGMGAILKGHDAELGRDIAVKVMLENHKGRTDLLQRFVEEAQIGGQLQHPGIVPIYDFGRAENERPYFTMKLIKGRTLAALLKERTARRATESAEKSEGDSSASTSAPLCDTLPRFLGIFQQICQTMAYAHSRGVIHRDLKPANIMVGAFGEVQVMDWGLAKVLPNDGDQPSRDREGAQEATAIRTVRNGRSDTPTHNVDADTLGGQVLGTPAYMPPEQANGEIHVLDERCDVFGLGAILCVILTGKPPYVGPDTSEIHYQARKGKLDDAHARLDACGAEVELIALCKCCLAPAKVERPRDAGAAADAVTAYLESVQQRLQQTQIDKAQAQTKAREERKRRKVQLALAAAVLLLLVGGAAGGFWYQRVEHARSLAHDHRQNDIRTAINRAEEFRAILLTKLANEKECRILLNTPEVWTAQIVNAREALQRAKDLLSGAQRDIDPDLSHRETMLVMRLNEDEKDKRMALDLERIREERFLIDEQGKLDFAPTLNKYRRTFRLFGLDVNKQNPVELSRRVSQSSIRVPLKTALADFAYVAATEGDKVLARRILQIGRLTNSEPFMKKFFDRNVLNNRAASAQLADGLMGNQERFDELPPQIISFLAKYMPQKSENHERWLRWGQLSHPKDFWLAYELGCWLQRNKKPAEAAGYFQTALAIRPKAFIVWQNYAIALRDSGHHDASIRAYKKILADDESTTRFRSRAWFGLGVTFAVKNDMAAAIDAYKRSLALDSNRTRVWYDLGCAYQARKNFTAAIDAFEKAAEINGRWSQPWSRLGSVYFDKNDLNSAMKAYSKALKINAKSRYAWGGLGQVLGAKNDLRGAIRAYKKAIAIDSNVASIWNNLGNCLVKQKEPKRAIEALKKSIAIDNNLDSAWYNLGNAFVLNSKLADAIEAYKKAIALNDQDPRYWTNLGVALANLNDLPAAVNAYREALAIDKHFFNAQFNLAGGLAEMNDLRGAIEEFKKTTALDKQDVSAHFHLATSLRRFGEINEAIASYQQVLDLLPKQHKLRTQTEGWLRRCRKLLEMNKRVDLVLNSEKSNAAERLQLAVLCQLYLRRFRDAVELYTIAFAAEPKLANDLSKHNRYNAACAAALAAAGKGKDAAKINDKEKATMRKTASKWLQTDIQAWEKQFHNSPHTAPALQGTLQHWQTDEDLADVRDEKALKKLPAAERKEWQDFWSQVDQLQKKARASYSEVKLQGTLINENRKHRRSVKLTAGKTYVIDMTSKHFDTYLYLRNPQGKPLAENDNVAKGKSNSRIVFTAKQDGIYQVIAHSFEHRGRGSYEIMIREFARAPVK